MEELRHCRVCKFVKPATEFYASVTNCKVCHRKAVAAHRSENIEAIRAYDRARANAPARLAHNVATVAQWRAAHPERYKAQNTVNNALRDGKLKRQPCWVCGEKAVAHHPDYSRPLDVVWLCQAHHKQAHALIKEAA